MSALLTSTPHPKRRVARIAARIAFVVLCGAACGLTVAPTAVAQPTPTKLEDIDKKGTQADPKSPVPGDSPRRKPYADFAIKNTDRKMFAEIKDFTPGIAAETQNAGEYDAWIEFMLHVKGLKCSAADLENHAARDLSVIELWKPISPAFRCELLRFDGKLVCIRRLEAPLVFQNNPRSGIKELYEARFVPLDESPLMPVSIVFTDLPEAFADVRNTPYREWLDKEAWISAAGFYFKTMSVPNDQGRAMGVPVLVGKSITPLSGPPAPPGNDPTALDPNVRVFKFINDDSAMIRTAPTDLTWPEVAAYNRIILHAARFTPEELEEHALTDVKFADLFEKVRKDYQFKNVKMEGRLISLRRMEVNNELRAAGVNQAFEGWLVPATEPSGNPVCIVFTEPLEDVEPGGRVNKWVSFAGFSFKLMRYESAEKYENEPNRHKVKKAPLLIGKQPISRRDPEAATSLTWGGFMQGAIICAALLIVAGGGLAWWYRSGDRKAKEVMEAARSRNPFDPASAPPAN